MASTSPNSYGIDTGAIQLFAKNLARVKAGYGEPATAGERYKKQKDQLETLVALETEFRKTLIAHSAGNWVYKKFVHFICEEKRNILAARPYFRERQKLFTNEISVALKKRAEKSLYRFHANFQFILFAVRSRDWKPLSPIRRIFRKIDALRTEIVETNMPLALNRARLFFSKTPASHLAYMDLVQISSEGLMSAIDKFCLPFSSTFRSVAIGRMVGNFIENYSETQLHFYPVDKRKIYRANKFAGKHVNGIDPEKLTAEVNKDVDKAYRTNPDEIMSLMAASSCVSADTGTVRGVASLNDDAVNVPKLVDRFEAPEDTRPDVRVEQQDALSAMYTAIKENLSILEVKLLRLMGVSVPEAVLQ